MGRHSGRENEALLSSISFASRETDSWVVAPIAVLISAGVSSSPSSATSATGGAAVDVVVVGVSWVLCELQPAARMQIPASASAIRRCMCPPLDAVPVDGPTRSKTARAQWPGQDTAPDQVTAGFEDVL